MAAGAIGQVQGTARCSVDIRGQTGGPDDIVRVHVEKPCFRVERRAAPFGAAIEARENYRLLAYAERYKLTLTAERPKFFERPLVNLRSSIREHVRGEQLAREGGGLGGKQLRFRSHLAGGGAGRILFIFDRKQQLSIGAV